MLIIIGATGVGKSTLAKKIANGKKIISAGKWVREEYKGDNVYDLTNFAIEKLCSEPEISTNYLNSQIEKFGRDIIVEGIRNPQDIFNIVRPGDTIIDLGGRGITTFEQSGLEVIRASKQFLELIQVDWHSYMRHIAKLPNPIKCNCPKFMLGEDGDGFRDGEILAIESYIGYKPTAFWKDDETGGTFSDLPLIEFYKNADVGSPVVEISPIEGPVSIFDRDKNYMCNGDILFLLHWPAGHTWYHILRTENNSLLGWPPHKLLVGYNNKGPLPKWKKHRF